MNEMIRNKIDVEEIEMIKVPDQLTLHSFDLLISRLRRKYPPNSVIEIQNKNKIKITFIRSETDEEYVIRKTKEEKQKDIKYKSNVKSDFFKIINRKR